MTGLGQIGALGRGLGLTPIKGVGDIIRSIFADGTDGFYFDFSKTDRLFQNLTGTPADGAGENIYLGLESHSWGGRTLAQELAQQTELVANGSFATGDLTGFTDADTGTGTSAYEAGAMRLVGVDASNRGFRHQLLSLTSGKRYHLSWTGSTSSGGATIGIGTAAIASANTSASVAGSGGEAFFTAAATNYFLVVTNSGGGDVTVDNISIKEIPGNHGLQATTAAQPKWQAGGLARFDGSDDNLLTTLAPGAANTLMAKVAFPASIAATQVIIGGEVTSGANIGLAVRSTGLIGGAVGSQNTTTIQGTSDLRGTTCVVALVQDGSNVRLYVNSASQYAAAQSGSIDTTDPLRIGSANSGGTATAFFAGDVYHALAIKKALPAAQIAAITNLWGTS